MVRDSTEEKVVGGKKQRNKQKQKATVTGRANVTSSHDWCDCIYSINIGIVTHFLQPPLPSSSPPLCHVCCGPSATSSLKEMASIMKHHLRRCWSCSAAHIDYVSPFAVNGVKVNGIDADFRGPVCLILLTKFCAAATVIIQLWNINCV